MADANLVATLIESTTFKIQQLQQAFAELESHRAVSLNLKWKELEDHFHGLEKSLKNRFEELKDQERQYETKVSEARERLKRREAEVVAKERASLKRLQEKRDAVCADIRNAFKRRRKSPPERLSNAAADGETNNTSEGSHGLGIFDKTDAGNTVPTQSADATPMIAANADDKNATPLVMFCKEMDAKGLCKYISDNRKNLASIREEIPESLRKAPDPFHLVLSSLKDFYNLELSPSDGKKDAVLLGVQRTCVMLMESLSVMLATSASGYLLICDDTKAQAKSIADEWKPKLGGLELDSTSGNSLEVHAFLQLIATFGIVSVFDQDEICKLVPYVSRRRQIVDLCRSLGLTQRMPGVIDMLVNSGRQVDAVNLASAFGLTEQFPPVPLLKNYLKEATKPQVKSGSTSPGAQNEDFEKELHALKAIIKCIEEHNLEEKYPVDPLQKRLVQLEKAKADKKRVTEVAKPQTKRSRANNNINPVRSSCGYGHRINNIPEKSFYRPLERYPYGYDCQYMPQPEAHVSPVRGSPYALPPSHGSYYRNGGYQYHQYYQAPYIH